MKKSCVLFVDVKKVLSENNVEDVLKVDGWDGNVFDVGYVDDMEFNVIADADEMENNLKMAEVIIHNAILEHGMEVNYKNGKTETIVTFYGKGFRKVLC